MIGQKLSIVTDKPQTTRHRILGICSAPEYQVCFLFLPMFMTIDKSCVFFVLKFMDLVLDDTI